MKKAIRGLLCTASVFVLGLSLSCNTQPQLESISISPSAASAQDSQQGQVHFVATGTYSDGSVVTPLPVIWGFHAPWIKIPDHAGITIDSDGLTQCTTFKGTESIVAIAPVNPGVPLSAVNVTTPAVTGTAHLTCQ